MNRNYVEINIDEVPQGILELKSLQTLKLNFIDSVKIPEELKNVEIEYLYIKGKINEEQKSGIKKLFPFTNVYINNRLVE